MKIRLLMRDKEYAEAFISKLSDYHADVYVEVIEMSELGNTDSTCVILTDYEQNLFEQSDLNRFSAQIIFISNKVEITQNNYMFKYQSFNLSMAQIAGQYYALTGDRVRYCGSSDLICVCGDCADYDYGYVNKSIGSKLKYCKGGEYLLISLQPINNYGFVDVNDRGRLSKIIYTLDSNKRFSLEEFCRSDEYGVYYLSLGIGINRLALLDWKTMWQLIERLKNYFAGIVVDVGSSFTLEAVRLINEADSIWWISDKYTDKIISQIIADPESKELHVLDCYKEDVDLEIDEIISNGGYSD